MTPVVPFESGRDEAVPSFTPPAPSGRVHAWAYLFIGAVCAAGAVVLYLTRDALTTNLVTMAVLLVVTLAAEFMWMPTVTGRATSSMASTANFAALLILGTDGAVWVVALAAGIATVAIQRRSLLKGVFNLAQVAVAIAVAGWFYEHAGGSLATLESFRSPSALVPFLNAGVAYFAVNTILVSIVVALWERLPVIQVWRQNYGYADDLLTSLALFLLSPLMALAYLVLGIMGLLLCFVPMALVRNAALRYIELQRAQQAMVWNERMAAMGEMAAEIGHELSNVLQVITAQAQMLLTDSDGVRGDRSERATRLIFERAADMRRLTKGLVDFSHREVVPRQEDVVKLVRESVDLVRPQRRYDGVAFQVDIAGDTLMAEVDGGQLRQVLVNLFRNAVEAMDESRERVIRVRLEPAGSSFRLEVGDTGGGFPSDFIDRVFEPWLTTKPDGHGFGLAVCYRIVENHGGSIRATNPSEGGALVVIEMPRRRPKGSRAMAA